MRMTITMKDNGLLLAACTVPSTLGSLLGRPVKAALRTVPRWLSTKQLMMSSVLIHRSQVFDVFRFRAFTKQREGGDACLWVCGCPYVYIMRRAEKGMLLLGRSVSIQRTESHVLLSGRAESEDPSLQLLPRAP
jgi:hypothetical protein